MSMDARPSPWLRRLWVGVVSATLLSVPATSAFSADLASGLATNKRACSNAQGTLDISVSYMGSARPSDPWHVSDSGSRRSHVVWATNQDSLYSAIFRPDGTPVETDVVADGQMASYTPLGQNRFELTLVRGNPGTANSGLYYGLQVEHGGLPT